MVKNQSVAAALLLVFIVGLIANEKNIRSQRSKNFERSFAAPQLEVNGGSASRAIAIDHDFVNSDRSAENEPKNTFHSEAEKEEDSQEEDDEGRNANESRRPQSPAMSNNDIVTPDCLTARKDTVDVSSYRNLPKPYINLGFPKMGTSSLHNYFKCGGLKSTHFRCRKRQSCALCTRNSVIAGLPPLTQCGEADAYTQLDDGRHFPQIELLEQFVHGHPDATFFLTFRNMKKWYHSISNWPPRKNGPHMDDRWKEGNISGSPSNEGESNLGEFSDWYCKHVKRVRNLVGQNPSHTLVEIDIEDSGVGQRMEDIFGFDQSCWGNTNVNARIHSDVNRSEVMLSSHSIHPKKHNRREDKDRDDEDYYRDEMNDDDDEQTNGSAENGSTNIFDSEADEKVESHEEGGESRDANEFSLSQPSDTGIHDIVTPDCLRARHDTVPESLFQKLPKPHINLGFPKMGTSSLYHYFECGGLKASHLRCGNKSYKCARCTRESVEAGLPPLSTCGKRDVYTQLDDGQYFPQIELLEQFVHGHPDATFFLTFRNMTKWYHSISNWPPRKNGPHMDERWKRKNITGSPSRETESSPKEFSDWYCKHVKRVRNLVAQNPSHTLVEVDIEDPDIGQRMEDIFGIDKNCWGKVNVNAKIHPEVNRSEVKLSRYILKEQKADVLEDYNGDRINDNDDEQTNGSAENESKNSFGSKSEVEENSEDEGDRSHQVEDSSVSQLPGMSNNLIVTPDCLKARHDTVPESLFLKLPKPYINLGFPKMGTSSLWKFFKCGGLVSSHYHCPQDTSCRTRDGCSEFCAKCTKLSVESGLSPLSKCGKYDVYTQLDDGWYFPQIELLEQFVHGHPNATFFLTFRNMTKWYHSITNWPPMKAPRSKLDRRWKMENITGSPSQETESSPKEFSDWYCKHVKRVRNLVAQNPSHTLVEVDIEDPEIGQRMEDIFGIGKSCWGNRNTNARIHPEFNQSRVKLFNSLQ